MAITLQQVGTAISGAAKKFAGKPLGITSKVLGVATLASVVYDSHINARELAYSTDEVLSADRYLNLHKQYMTQDKQSASINYLKKGRFMAQMTNSCAHFGYKANGYLTGFINTVISNLPQIGLGALTLIATKKTGDVGSFISKAAGCLLGFHWIKTYLKDVVGIAARKSERHY